MTWFDKIRLGMELMKEGCADNLSHAKCEKECPFREFCPYLPNPLPMDWEVKDG